MDLVLFFLGTEVIKSAILARLEPLSFLFDLPITGHDPPELNLSIHHGVDLVNLLLETLV